MTNIKTTRRAFIKNSVITGAVTGSMLTTSGRAMAKMSSAQELGVSTNRVVPILNQANMFDLPEAYAMTWEPSVEKEGRLSL